MENKAMQEYFIKRSDALSSCGFYGRHGADVDDATYTRIEELPAADVRPAISREQLMAALEKYFEIGNSYTYELTRVKEAFAIGTMSLRDFVEWDSEKVADLCDYLFKNLLEEDGGDG